MHDVRCKVEVGDQIGRTEFENPNIEQKVVWNQTFKLYVLNRRWRKSNESTNLYLKPSTRS